MSTPHKALDLPRLLHEPARMGIMTSLVSRPEGVEFNELLRSLRLTRGNLATHVRRLEDAGYVKVHKGFVGRIPCTTYKITEKGRRGFADYLHALEEVLLHARTAANGEEP